MSKRQKRHLDEMSTVLPEITVTPNNVRLITYRPFIDGDYKWTGHSELRSPSRTFIEDPTWNGLTHGIDAIGISHSPRIKGYNLFTNNCADATRRALEDISGKRINPFLFTTPGDIKDFAEQELGGITYYKHGRYETIIPISQADRIKLANNNYYKQFGGSVRRSLATGGSIYIKPSHRGRLTELKARTGKSEAELYNDGNPAHKKMVVFARNARKWKH